MEAIYSVPVIDVLRVRRLAFPSVWAAFSVQVVTIDPAIASERVVGSVDELYVGMCAGYTEIGERVRSR